MARILLTKPAEAVPSSAHVSSPGSDDSVQHYGGRGPGAAQAAFLGGRAALAALSSGPRRTSQAGATGEGVTTVREEWGRGRQEVRMGGRVTGWQGGRGGRVAARVLRGGGGGWLPPVAYRSQLIARCAVAVRYSLLPAVAGPGFLASVLWPPLAILASAN